MTDAWARVFASMRPDCTVCTWDDESGLRAFLDVHAPADSMVVVGIVATNTSLLLEVAATAAFVDVYCIRLDRVAAHVWAIILADAVVDSFLPAAIVDYLLRQFSRSNQRRATLQLIAKAGGISHRRITVQHLHACIAPSKQTWDAQNAVYVAVANSLVPYTGDTVPSFYPGYAVVASAMCWPDGVMWATASGQARKLMLEMFVQQGSKYVHGWRKSVAFAHQRERLYRWGMVHHQSLRMRFAALCLVVNDKQFRNVCYDPPDSDSDSDSDSEGVWPEPGSLCDLDAATMESVAHAWVQNNFGNAQVAGCPNDVYSYEHGVNGSEFGVDHRVWARLLPSPMPETVAALADMYMSALDGVPRPIGSVASLSCGSGYIGPITRFIAALPPAWALQVCAVVDRSFGRVGNVRELLTIVTENTAPCKRRCKANCSDPHIVRCLVQTASRLVQPSMAASNMYRSVAFRVACETALRASYVGGGGATLHGVSFRTKQGAIMLMRGCTMVQYAAAIKAAGASGVMVPTSDMPNVVHGSSLMSLSDPLDLLTTEACAFTLAVAPGGVADGVAVYHTTVRRRHPFADRAVRALYVAAVASWFNFLVRAHGCPPHRGTMFNWIVSTYVHGGEGLTVADVARVDLVHPHLYTHLRTCTRCQSTTAFLLGGCSNPGAMSAFVTFNEYPAYYDSGRRRSNNWLSPWVPLALLRRRNAWTASFVAACGAMRTVVPLTFHPSVAYMRTYSSVLNKRVTELRAILWFTSPLPAELCGHIMRLVIAAEVPGVASNGEAKPTHCEQAAAWWQASFTAASGERCRSVMAWASDGLTSPRAIEWRTTGNQPW